MSSKFVYNLENSVMVSDDIIENSLVNANTRSIFWWTMSLLEPYSQDSLTKPTSDYLSYLLWWYSASVFITTLNCQYIPTRIALLPRSLVSNNLTSTSKKILRVFSSVNQNTRRLDSQQKYILIFYTHSAHFCGTSQLFQQTEIKNIFSVSTSISSYK